MCQYSANGIQGSSLFTLVIDADFLWRLRRAIIMWLLIRSWIVLEFNATSKAHINEIFQLRVVEPGSVATLQKLSDRFNGHMRALISSGSPANPTKDACLFSKFSRSWKQSKKQSGSNLFQGKMSTAFHRGSIWLDSWSNFDVDVDFLRGWPFHLRVLCFPLLIAVIVSPTYTERSGWTCWWEPAYFLTCCRHLLSVI